MEKRNVISECDFIGLLLGMNTWIAGKDLVKNHYQINNFFTVC